MNVRDTQIVIEILRAGTPEVFDTQSTIEAFRGGVPNVRDTQITLEVFRGAGNPIVRNTQFALEILKDNPSGCIVTQEVTEILRGGIPHVYLTQSVIEILRDTGDYIHGLPPVTGVLELWNNTNAARIGQFIFVRNPNLIIELEGENTLNFEVDFNDPLIASILEKRYVRLVDYECLTIPNYRSFIIQSLKKNRADDLFYTIECEALK